ncbi:ATP-binding protein [Chryseobacterium sp. NRRL B-14859]|uniref:tetratricopeptide repeat-containing sensor histidine kinase n=1 Tax=unclassified Chryseobacterium TaxID=2593645 RepID=UPI000F44D805|nr:ATP-binding protein [Chryseobacterium sp. G0240]ROH98854.1 hypothetical protein EGI16_20040 [Chryseobacterium sp. G0240]
MARFLFFILLAVISCRENNSINENTVIGDSFYRKGEKLFQKNDIQAYQNFQKAITYYKLSYDSSNISKALIFQANIQNSKGDYIGAEETLVEALNYMKEDDPSYFSVYGTMANIKFSQKEYLSSIKWSDKTLSENNIDYDIRARVLNNKAVAFSKIKDYKNAINILKKIVLDSIQKKNTIYTIQDNTEYFLWLANNSYDAETNMEKILKTKTLENDTWGMNSSYSHLADFNKDKNPKKSLFYAQQMLVTATKNKSPEDRLEALEKILIVDTPSNSKKIFNKYKNLSDSIQLSRNSYSNRFAYIKYDSEKSNADNQKLKADNSKKQNNILLLLVALIIAIIIIISFRKRQIRLKQEKEIEVKNTQLKMSKKVHDVVANGLYHMMIDVQNNPEMDKTRILNDIEKMYEESRDISHENIAEKDFALRFINMITSYTSDEQKVLPVGYKENIWENISYNTQLELYYILREILVNMRKHSHAKLASVRFEKDNENLKIRYTDNGIGINNLDQQKGTGIYNTENRIESIGGDITFEKNPTGGLIIRITIPI